MNGELSTYSGEYLDKGVEAAFREERFHETVRMSRIFLLMSAVINLLFLASDWRFYGDPHFWVAIPARAFVVAISVLCAALNECVKTPRGAQINLVFYEACVAIAVGFLVTSHSVLAIFAVIALPAIYYLALPTSFAITVTMGVFCSVTLLVGFITWLPEPGLEIGLVLAMFTINTALIIIVSKGNRLRRLEWAAAQATLHANTELDASRKMLEKIFMAVPIPLIVTEHDSGRVMHANRAAARYFGGLEHLRQQDSIKLIYADPNQRDELMATIDERGHIDGFEITIALKDGTHREMLLSGSRIELDGKDCVITGGVDISARKAMEARLEELATRDPLTSVLNRTAFLERAASEMDRARRAIRPLSVIMIDLDYFKLDNDAFGHAAGDLTLKAFADLCRAHLRAHDFIGRLGGEEFACVLIGADRPEAQMIAERLRHAVEDLRIEGAPSNLRVTISIGVSEMHDDDQDVAAALARADLALYGAKMRGRNKVVLADQIETDEPRALAIASASA